MTRSTFEVILAVDLERACGGTAATDYCHGEAGTKYTNSMRNLVDPPKSTKLPLSPDQFHDGANKAWDDSRAFESNCNAAATRGLNAGFSLDQLKPLLNGL